MALSLTAVHQIAEDVLGCVCRTLTATAEQVEGQPGCPCRACVVPGQAAWDSCEDPCDSSDGIGGQLTVNVARIYQTTLEAFPSTETKEREVRGRRGCQLSTLTAVELVITLLRCVPVPSDGACPPSCEELSAAARVINIDAVSVMNAVDCCLPSLSARRLGLIYSIGVQRQVGPQGGCAGVEQRVTVGLVNCRCPEEESP